MQVISVITSTSSTQCSAAHSVWPVQLHGTVCISNIACLFHCATVPIYRVIFGKTPVTEHLLILVK